LDKPTHFDLLVRISVSDDPDVKIELRTPGIAREDLLAETYDGVPAFRQLAILLDNAIDEGAENIDDGWLETQLNSFAKP